MNALPSMGSARRAFGTPAAVRRPGLDASAIDTVVIWLPSLADEAPFSERVGKTGARLVLALDRADVPTAPQGTRIVAAPMSGGPAVTWQVDGIVQSADAHEIRVAVIQVNPNP